MWLLLLLALVALTYSMIVPHDAVLSNIFAMVGVPPGDARGLVQHWLVPSLARHAGRGIALILSSGLTLFSLGRSLMRGLDITIGVDRDRGALAKQGVALAIVLSGFG